MLFWREADWFVIVAVVLDTTQTEMIELEGGVATSGVVGVESSPPPYLH